MMNASAPFTPEPADDQDGGAAIIFSKFALPASDHIQNTAAVRTAGSLIAPYIKVFSVSVLLSRR
jgi:hypothetical protein